MVRRERADPQQLAERECTSSVLRLWRRLLQTITAAAVAATTLSSSAITTAAVSTAAIAPTAFTTAFSSTALAASALASTLTRAGTNGFGGKRVFEGVPEHGGAGLTINT